MSVHVTHGTFVFCLTVGASGAVSRTHSQWALRQLSITERISSAGHHVSGRATAHGGGHLAGRAAGVKVKGAESMTITFTVDGHWGTTSVSFSVATTMPIATASAHRVTGDVALKARAAQQHAWFASDEHAPYVARPVARCSL